VLGRRRVRSLRGKIAAVSWRRDPSPATLGSGSCADRDEARAYRELVELEHLATRRPGGCRWARELVEVARRARSKAFASSASRRRTHRVLQLIGSATNWMVAKSRRVFVTSGNRVSQYYDRHNFQSSRHPLRVWRHGGEKIAAGPRCDDRYELHGVHRVKTAYSVVHLMLRLIRGRVS